MTAKAAKDVLKKEWIRTGDIKVYFGCSEGKACQIMKEIKLFQDSTGGFLRGVCHTDDLKAWIAHNKESKAVRANV